MGGSESIIPLPTSSLRDCCTVFRPSLCGAAAGPWISLTSECNSVCVPVLRSLAACTVSFYCSVNGQKVVLGDTGDGTGIENQIQFLNTNIYIYHTHLYIYYK